MPGGENLIVCLLKEGGIEECKNTGIAKDLCHVQRGLRHKKFTLNKTLRR